MKDFLAKGLENCFDGEDLFSFVDKMEGQLFRKIDDRRTIRVRIDGAYYFAKIHQGVGWFEIMKNLMQGRLPVLGARNEWLALRALKTADVPSMTPVLFCERGFNPAKRRSAILTEALDFKITLEDFETKDPILKKALIIEVAKISKKMHGAGVNHRDFYLCHFLLNAPRAEKPKFKPILHLIDLHRAQVRKSVPRRWLVKDLGGLLFSALEKNLTKRDLLRFIREYDPRPLRKCLSEDDSFWREVVDRAIRLWMQRHDSTPEHLKKLLLL